MMISFARGATTRWLVGAAFALLCWARVGAQNAPQSQSTAASQTLEEVVVTAQHRSENEQDVPISISTLTGAQLRQDNVTNIRDLTVTTPSLVMGGVGANLAPAIRGVHSDQNDPGNDPNVALYVDGVYMPNQITNNMALEDVSRIEVLEGPQGTLFGRNATGGAIRIFTLEPSLDKFTGYVDAGGGNYGHATADAFTSYPLINNELAVSLSGHYDRIDGYNYNVVTQTETDPSEEHVLRLKVLAKPIDSLTIEPFGVLVHSFDGDGTAYLALNGNSYARNIPGAIIPSQPYTYTTATAPSAMRANAYTSGLRINWSTDYGDLSSLTAYISENDYYSNDASASSINVLSYPVFETDYTTQQELTFASKKIGQFSFTSGANYYQDSGRYDPLILEGLFIGPTPEYGWFKQHTNAYGIFSEVDWTPTDRITLIAGNRYSSERRAAYGTYYFTSARPGDLPPIGVPTTFDDNTPRASIRYRLTEQDDNVYFTYSQGFKSGGFDLAGVQATPYLPEKLDSYEVGLKTSPERMFSANFALYYYNYTNLQVAVLNGLTNSTTNAASARVYGAEAQLMARLTPEFTLRAGLSYLNSMYVNYPDAPALVPIGGPSCMCGNESSLQNFSGRNTPFAPRNSGSVTGNYKTTLSAGTLDLSASFYYTARYLLLADGDLYQNPYQTLALRASFRPTDSKFTVYAWGKNVTSKEYIAYGFSSVAADSFLYARPATYGAGVKFDF